MFTIEIEDGAKRPKSQLSYIKTRLLVPSSTSTFDCERESFFPGSCEAPHKI